LIDFRKAILDEEFQRFVAVFSVHCASKVVALNYIRVAFIVFVVVESLH